MEEKQQKPVQNKQDSVSFIPLGGIEDVTRNMYVYEYKNEILIVDCGIGFADESMLGVDLLLPDITYLLKTEKKIVGMVLTHGHEDHIGAVPFILPQLNEKLGYTFPIYASRLTAALTNEKLREFRMDPVVKTVNLEKDSTVKIGSFHAQFIRITHSVPDSAHIFIKTPVGNFYHGSDFKIDLTPADNMRSDLQGIAKTSIDGVLCLMSDCLGSEHQGMSLTEANLYENIEKALESCTGKFFLTTYSSNISRLNQAIAAAEKHNRKVCFVGRSLIKVKDIGQKLGLLHMKPTTEVPIEALKNYSDKELMLLIAGSQGQENSALTRVANGEHKEIKMTHGDMVVFSSDTIPGNEISVNALIDAIAKRGGIVKYSDLTHKFHVSGHGYSKDLMLLMSLTKPKHVLPISGTYKHMVAYRGLAEEMGYKKDQIHLTENGQELIFTKHSVKRGKKFPIKHVYVDQVSGEEVESFVLRDRERLAKDGIIVVMTEIESDSGQLAENFGIVTRGFSPKDTEFLEKNLLQEIKQKLSNKKEKVGNWVHMRRVIEGIAGKYIDRSLRRRPLILPVIIEV